MKHSWSWIRSWSAPALALVGCALLTLPTPAKAQLSDAETREIAEDTYIYAYPIVLMEVTRQVMTAVPAPTADGHAPMNQIGHRQTFPDASFDTVVRTNVDTLFSFMWFDVSKEPLIVSVEDSGGRYYLLHLLDMWTDSFASPGSRTTGNQAQKFAIVGPDWHGTLPAGVDEIRSPTSMGWMIGRTQTNGAPDYPAVHKFQAGVKVVPLRFYGKSYQPKPAAIAPEIDLTAPVDQVGKMSPELFYTTFLRATGANPPHSNDHSMVARMKRIGLVPGKSFDFAAAPVTVQNALRAAPAAAMPRIQTITPQINRFVDGWGIPASPMGTYGTDYLKRAVVAYFGLGANPVEDAIYPTLMAGPDGKPLDSAVRYVLHFDKDELPPARAFWSLTMYNDRQFFAANPINRYALGDRDKLKFNDDGSLDIYIQRDRPHADKVSNWLPTPAEGGFSMNLRLYHPERRALDGVWSPPAIEFAK